MERKPLRVLELYSGMGGMHCALQRARIIFQVISAFDINTVANDVYKHNFPRISISQRLIESMKISDFDNKFCADLWTMSPPCQPFSRQGAQQGSDDARTKSFLFLLKVLQEVKHPPKYILLENVKGFECSHTCQSFLDVLKERGYRFQQFLLNSDQFGIPNSRLRYYLIAKKTVEGSDSNMDDEGFTPTENILTSLPKEWWDDLHEKPSDFKKKEAKENSKTLLGHILSAPPHSLQPEIACKNGRAMHAQIKQLAHFLDDETKVTPDDLLNEKTVCRYSRVIDIVKDTDNHSMCFTKGYGAFAEGTGSAIRMADIGTEEQNSMFHEHELWAGWIDQCQCLPCHKTRTVSGDTATAQHSTASPPAESDPKRLKRKHTPPTHQDETCPLLKLKLRYFTPNEIKQILGFPESLSFPDHATTKQKRRLLGNSLNVTVVSILFSILFHNSGYVDHESIQHP
eukprot:m.44893 g.44893  ORF g.44893 m.44893 type:complete len:457 (+) comp10158_c0_seq2:105-1475(+)